MLKLIMLAKTSSLTWSHPNSEQVSQLLVYLKYAQQWQYHIYSSEERVISVKASECNDH